MVTFDVIGVLKVAAALVAFGIAAGAGRRLANLVLGRKGARMGFVPIMLVAFLATFAYTRDILETVALCLCVFIAEMSLVVFECIANGPDKRGRDQGWTSIRSKAPDASREDK